MSHQWYDVTSRDSSVEKEICVDLACRCGITRTRPKVQGIDWGQMKAGQGEWLYVREGDAPTTPR